MKRLAIKRLPEKMMMAAIILSCGFVLQGEPTAVKEKKVADTHRVQKAQNLERSWHSVLVDKLQRNRQHLAAW